MLDTRLQPPDTYFCPPAYGEDATTESDQELRCPLLWMLIDSLYFRVCGGAVGGAG